MARWSSLRSLVTALLLLLVGAVSGWRALGLAGDPRRPSARLERRFMDWAWREPRVTEIFAALEERLPAGRPVLLLVDPKQRHNAGWWRFMASYHLPANPVAEVQVAAPAEAPAGDRAVIFFPAAGEPEVVDHGSRR